MNRRARLVLLVSPSEALTRTTRKASGLCVRVRFGGFNPPTRTGSFYLRDFRVISRIVRTEGQDEDTSDSVLFTGSNPDTLRAAS